MILDTETTDLDSRAEIVQIGIISLDGSELFDSLVRPAKARRWTEATRVHGISWPDVKDAPMMSELAGELKRISDAHSALGDAKLTAALIRKIDKKLSGGQERSIYSVAANKTSLFGEM